MCSCHLLINYGNIQDFENSIEIPDQSDDYNSFGMQVFKSNLTFYMKPILISNAYNSWLLV